MTAEPIRLDEWEAELARLQETAGGEGLTSRELGEHWQCGPKTVISRLHQLQDAGRLVVCSKKVLSLSGRLTPVASYKLKKEVES